MSESDSKNIPDTSGPLSSLADQIKRSMAEALSAEQQRLAEEEEQKAQKPEDRRPRVAIAEALRNNWFEFWYQPKIDLKRKCLAGAEALARIRHPEHGVLLPGSFLADVDEDSIAELAQHTFIAAMGDWSVFEDAGFNLKLSINAPVSVLFKLPTAQLMSEHRPKSERWPGLIVEVTEDQIVRDMKLAKDIAGQLRVSGISMAIDDFGAGYTSFRHLKALTVDIVKIDGAFVRKLSENFDNQLFIRTLIGLAEGFGLGAVAECVETEADARLLEAEGVVYLQGWHFGKPIVDPDWRIQRSRVEIGHSESDYRRLQA